MLLSAWFVFILSINPITGVVEEDKPDPMEGMTEEEKEYEAMKLVQMFDKLSRLVTAQTHPLVIHVLLSSILVITPYVLYDHCEKRGASSWRCLGLWRLYSSLVRSAIATRCLLRLCCCEASQCLYRQVGKLNDDSHCAVLTNEITEGKCDTAETTARFPINAEPDVKALI